MHVRSLGRTPARRPIAPRPDARAAGRRARLQLAAALGLASLSWAACCPEGSPAAGAGSPPLPARPARVVPASATAVDFAAALLEPARIAGVPEQALDYSAPVAQRRSLEGVPRFDAYLAEPVLLLRPDLVIADPWQSADTRARLAEAGIPVLSLPQIRDWPGARAALLELGRALDAEERASDLARDLDRRVERLREGSGARRGLRAVCYSNFGAAGWSAGSGTTIHAMMELAGLTNAAAESGREGHVGLGFEDLLLIDPDLILVSEPLREPPGPAGDRGGASGAVLLAEPSLAGLRAVRERAIVSLPAWLYATGSHELVRGAEVLAGEVDQWLERRDGGFEHEPLPPRPRGPSRQ